MLSRNKAISIIKHVSLFAFLVCAFLLLSEVASFASDGGDLPWSTGLEKLTNALSGKLAGFIVMVGLFFVGGMLIFGGDLGNFGKSLMMLVLVGSALGGLAKVVTAFVVTGSMIP